MNMPSVVEVDSSTATVLHDAFGITSSGRSLYRVGRDTLRTPDGSKLSLHLFSYMSNDTLMTSPDSSFQITAGAEMQLLVGIRRK
jgi:hypothetical protein